MKEITILSGKGGAGKTSITAALATVAKNAVFCDNDVDAADLHLLFQPIINEENTFFSGWKTAIDPLVCNSCNVCVSQCRFDAIHLNIHGHLEINPFQCEGCRLCERTCPENAISSERNSNNHWYVSTTRFGSFVHAQMGIGEENSGKLVTQIRKKAKEIAKESKSDFIINDGPPGIGCATIASLSGTNRVLIVVEPTKSGLHDAMRLVELIESFEIETFALINKSDINEDIVMEIEDFLNLKNIQLLAKLPFDEEMVESMINGKTIVEYNKQSNISRLMNNVWNELSA